MRSTGGDLVSSAFLRVVVAGPPGPGAGAGAQHAHDLAAALADAGHEVVVLGSPTRRERRPVGAARVAWSRSVPVVRDADVVVLVPGDAASTARLLALVLGLAELERRGGEPPRPTRLVVVEGDRLERPTGRSGARLARALLRHCDAALVHDLAAARAATALGAPRVSVVPRPAGCADHPTVAPPPGATPRDRTPGRSALPVGSTPCGPPPRPRTTSWRRPDGLPTGPAVEHADHPDVDDRPALTADWARYVGAVEAIAAPLAPAPPAPRAAPTADGPEGRSPGRPGWRRSVRAARSLGAALTARAGWGDPRPLVALARPDLPDWVVPTDVLVDGPDADEAVRVAAQLGLPRVDDASSAWAALGALAAVVRLVDDGRRSAVVVHETGRPGEPTGAPGSGPPDPAADPSPFGRWAVAAGFAPVALGLTDPAGSVADLDVDLGSLDALVRIHPHGCDADDVDEAVGQASWALRQGGVLVLTVPLAGPGVPGALTPADLRGLVARAHEAGLVLVGDLDGHLAARLSAAASARSATAGDGGRTSRVRGPAHGMARLVLRRA